MRLLSECGLPTDDLRAGAATHFIGVQSGNGLAAVVGIEVFGKVALLRSLAVSERSRAQGLGARLVAAIETYAVSRQVHQMYLLTTTAEGFFVKYGYVRVERSEAPEEISASSEFASLCPQSAAFMTKRICAPFDKYGRGQRP